MKLFGSVFAVLVCLLSVQKTAAQVSQEDKYYDVIDIEIPKDIVLEVGGMAFDDKKRLGITTRRGEFWLIDKPLSSTPQFNLFASGFHESLGLAYRNESWYFAQRGELTKATDTNNDDKADYFKTIYKWPVTGNYHEYSYGPLFDENGDMLVTLNLSWIGYGASLSKWRGWLLKITEKGDMEAIATGMRSPAGFGFNKEGDFFYGENQGDWIGSGYITHVEKGDFLGNPKGLKWSKEPESPLKNLTAAMIPDSLGTMYDAAQSIAALKVPSVWFPHTVMGISTSDIICDTTKGAFGPYEGQLFVADQGHSKVMRVALEQVNGVYQGACFPFREGLASGVLRLAWAPDGSLVCGQTSRGWAATGKASFALQRIKWNKKIPFEMKAVKALPDGFEIEFTKPVNANQITALENYQIQSFTYHYRSDYGSPAIHIQDCKVTAVESHQNGLKARLTVNGLRPGFIHEIKLGTLRSGTEKLLHDFAYYTLNQIPGEGGMNQKAVIAPVRNFNNKVSDQRPSSWKNEVVTKIVIGTIPDLKYDKSEITVNAGEKIALTFENRDDMMHNWVLVKPGTTNAVAKGAIALGINGQANGYVPDSDDVLQHTGLLAPLESKTLYFEAPKVPGTYEYVCTFPGHAASMRGVLIVK